MLRMMACKKTIMRSKYIVYPLEKTSFRFPLLWMLIILLLHWIFSYPLECLNTFSVVSTAYKSCASQAGTTLKGFRLKITFYFSHAKGKMMISFHFPPLCYMNKKLHLYEKREDTTCHTYQKIWYITSTTF